MLLSEYLNQETVLEENGVFDPVLEKDSSFFINIQRLRKATTTEFKYSYQKINDHFRKIIKLLDVAKSKDMSDICYKQAVEMFNFSEVNEICLGYSLGTVGAGFGDKLRADVISTAYDIVKLGVKDPELFELLPLFQANVGADRLSDMVATLILDDVKAYTRRINAQLGITKDNYPEYEFQDGFLVNPNKSCLVYLVPVEILHDLPVAKSWTDIDRVVAENFSIRNELNQQICDEWKDYTAQERKDTLLNGVFKRKDACSRVIGDYRNESLNEVELRTNIDYLWNMLPEILKQTGFNFTRHQNEIDSRMCSRDILDVFKKWVECNKGWELIQDLPTRSREKCVQRMIHLAGMKYVEDNNLDMSCEPDEGRGPVDFKISRGNDKSIIEVKLSSNSQCKHGFEVQLIEYGKAEETDNLFFVLIDVGHPKKVEGLKREYDRKVDYGEHLPEFIIIDANSQKSASRA